MKGEAEMGHVVVSNIYYYFLGYCKVVGSCQVDKNFNSLSTQSNHSVKRGPFYRKICTNYSTFFWDDAELGIGATQVRVIGPTMVLIT